MLTTLQFLGKNHKIKKHPLYFSKAYFKKTLAEQTYLNKVLI